MGRGRVYLDCSSLLYMVGEPAPTNIEMAGLLASPVSTAPQRKKQNTRNQRAQQPLNRIFK